jgi:hypothetical protein
LLLQTTGRSKCRDRARAASTAEITVDIGLTVAV